MKRQKMIDYKHISLNAASLKHCGLMKLQSCVSIFCLPCLYLQGFPKRPLCYLSFTLINHFNLKYYMSPYNFLLSLLFISKAISKMLNLIIYILIKCNYPKSQL